MHSTQRGSLVLGPGGHDEVRQRGEHPGAFVLVRGGEHHREHAELVGLRDLGATALHARALLLGRHMHGEQGYDGAVLHLQMGQDQLAQPGHRGRALRARQPAVADQVHERVHLGVLGLEEGEQPGRPWSARDQQGPVELVLLLVVTQQMVGDQPQLVLDDDLFLGRHRAAGESGRQPGQLVAQQGVGEDEADQLGSFGGVWHGWLLRRFWCHPARADLPDCCPKPPESFHRLNAPA